MAIQACEAFEPPKPLLEVQQAALRYPVDALGELLGPAVERLAEVIGVPCAMAAQSVLATTALARQGHANVHLDGRIYPLSLYLLTVACSGDRKSAVLVLNDAVRRHQVQHQAQPAGRSVAMAVAALSPRAKPATMGVVATVAAVATPP